MTSNWDNDLLLENEIGNFLDSGFYKWLVDKDYIKGWKRIKDKNLQLKGIDVVLQLYDKSTGKKRLHYVDEKSASHYLNQRIPTFALELTTFNSCNKTVNDGWLIDSTKNTDCYFFIWPDIIGWKYNKLCKATGFKQYKWQDKILCEHFSSMEIWMVSRSDLIELLKKEGLSLEKLKEIATKIRDNFGNVNFNPKQYDKMEKDNKRYNFIYSGHLKEKPINLILRKNVMKDIAKKFLIFENYIIDLDNDINL